MKKILIFLFVLLLAAAAGLAYFVATFDAERYKPQIIGQLESSLGKPVSLEHIGLGWHNGIALNLKGLQILQAEGGSPLVEIASASAVVRFQPLLHKDVEVSSIVIKKPSVRLIKGMDGQLRGFEKKEGKPQTGTAAGGAAESKSGAPSRAGTMAPAAVSLLIDYIEIEDGQVFYRDESVREPVEITLRDTDITLRNVSLTGPMQIQLRAALFNDSQNIRILGTLRRSVERKVNTLEEVHMEADLDSVDLREVARFAPAAADVSKLGGKLSADIQTLQLDAAGLRDLQAGLRLSEGSLKPARMKSGFENAAMEAIAEKGRIRVESFTAQFAGGALQGAGAYTYQTPIPLTSFEVNARNILLAGLAEPAGPEAPQIEGRLSAVFQGTAQGKGTQMRESLQGQGQINIEDGVIRNLNVLREVFSRLNMIPGLMQRLDERLPVDYREKLEANDTYLETVNLPLTAVNGVLSFDQLAVQTDTFGLRGAGNIRPDGRLYVQSMLSIDDALSAALVDSIRELQYIADAQGRLQIPLNVQGQLPQIAVIPDLQYLASKLAVSKTTEVLGGLLRGNQPVPAQSGQAASGAAASQTGTTAGTPGKYPKTRDLFGQLLQSALEGTSEEQASQQ